MIIMHGFSLTLTEQKMTGFHLLHSAVHGEPADVAPSLFQAGLGILNSLTLYFCGAGI